MLQPSQTSMIQHEERTDIRGATSQDPSSTKVHQHALASGIAKTEARLIANKFIGWIQITPAGWHQP